MITYLIPGNEVLDYLLTAKPFKTNAMKSRFKNVYAPCPRHYRKRNQWRGRIRIDGVVYDGYYKTEKEAATAIDKILIKHGKEPVNTLKRKEW